MVSSRVSSPVCPFHSPPLNGNTIKTNLQYCKSQISDDKITITLIFSDIDEKDGWENASVPVPLEKAKLGDAIKSQLGVGLMV